MQRFCRILTIALAMLLCGLPARAELTAQQNTDVARINTYLNGVTNIAGRFVQASPDGAVSGGAFYLARPGRARFEYDDQELVVVARGQRLLIKEGRFVTNELPLDGTPLKVLLGGAVDLAVDARILALETRAGTLAATIEDPTSPELGQVTLIFTSAGAAASANAGADNALHLQRWIVTDAQGLRTTVSLSEIRYPDRIDPDLFNLESEGSGSRGRRD